MKIEENDSLLLCPKTLSPIKELDEPEAPERHTSLDRDSGSSCADFVETVADPTFPGPLVSDDDPRSLGLSQRDHTTFDTPPISTPSSPHLPVFPISHLQVGHPVTPQREKVTRNEKRNTFGQLRCVTWLTHSSLDSRDVPEPPFRINIVDLPLPVLPRMALPRFSLSPSGIHKLLGRRSASSEPGNDRGNTEVGGAALDTLLDGLLGSVQSGDFRSTGNCCSERTWNSISLTIIFLPKKPRRYPAVGLHRNHQRSAISLAEVLALPFRHRFTFRASLHHRIARTSNGPRLLSYY